MGKVELFEGFIPPKGLRAADAGASHDETGRFRRPGQVSPLGNSPILLQ
jgi:hypothetical protein